MPYLLLSEAKVAIPLSPMVFWWQDPKAQFLDHGCCYLFDSEIKAGCGFSFKTVARPEQLTVTEGDEEIGELAVQLAAERAEDGAIEVVQLTHTADEEE